MTPELTAKPRRKIKLMRAGHVEEASATAKQICKDIMQHNKKVSK